MQELKTLHGNLVFPAFLPDATRAFIKSVESFDLAATQTPGIVVNSFHLYNGSLVNVIKKFGGIHQFMNWRQPIISDSGGFQLMSLIRDHPKQGKILDKKIIFHTQEGKKVIFTPEKVIQIQMRLKSDILMCLDDCTRPDETFKEQEKSVARTIDWAARCKAEFDKLTKNQTEQPLLFSIVQGGNHKKLRKKCASQLIKIGFDGYSFGGFPIDKNKRLITDILQLTADLLPNNKPKYGMGLGSPKNLIACVKMGYDLFDCVLPTRDARHKRLYVFKDNIDDLDILKDDFYDCFYLDKRIWRSEPKSVSAVCDCHLCQNYSRAYLYHLFKANDPLCLRLATIHNLRFYSNLMERLGKTVH